MTISALSLVLYYCKNVTANGFRLALGMPATLISNIRTLAGVHAPHAPLRGQELRVLPVIDNAYVLIEGDEIADYGSMDQLPAINRKVSRTVDATGRTVIPAWCDSHTHLVFAATRESEFIDKIRGFSYAEIAAKGGGILNSAARLQKATEDQLFDLAWKRLDEISRLGTGAVEIKSGYGLTVESELKMLRVIKRLRQRSNVLIKSTFLGAHAFPAALRDNPDEYIRQIIEEMLPVIATEKLADYIDVFCETGFFSPAQMEKIVRAGQQYGLAPKLHVNQLNSIGGIQSAIKLGAISVDHLETMSTDDITALRQSNTIGTLLPTAAFFLRMPYQPARELIDSGCAIALASDYNPGSSPSGNMNFVVSISSIQMKMLPEEAINAATINGAFAMGLGQTTGSIMIGKKANLIITKPIPSLAFIPYSFGSDCVEEVVLQGKWLVDSL